ncbi:hypothetical protein [Nonomuraea helvata]|uniref:Twin-arginine translocation signal domain-containing protein n=1 Tax=Nonomuraea helvata TaxID=37484 RepID=A0ABV5SDE5_9ACTN
MTDPHGNGLTRRTFIQAADTTAAAYSLISTVTGTANADDRPEAADRLVVYPVPAGAPANASFSVKARTPNGRWQPVPVLRGLTKIINEKTGSGIVRNTSVATLDINGTATKTLTLTMSHPV